VLSHWLDEAPLAAEDEAPTLHGTTRADVCIVGGGFCGLWTAIRLKERDPALDIVIVEKNRCGDGASGRNSGFVLIDSLRKFCASDEAVRLAQASAYTMQGMADFCAANEIDFGLRPDGWLWAATNKVQDDAWLALLDDLDHTNCIPGRLTTHFWPCHFLAASADEPIPFMASAFLGTLLGRR